MSGRAWPWTDRASWAPRWSLDRQLAGVEAAYQVAGARPGRLLERRQLAPGALVGERTQRGERAAGREIRRVRHRARDHLQPLPPLRHARERVEQPDRVGVLRPGEDVLDRRVLDHAAVEDIFA